MAKWKTKVGTEHISAPNLNDFINQVLQSLDKQSANKLEENEDE
jgi:hypothetical protein